ncbi:trigger factor [Megamonas rupellensis]|jgi:trigger factor|uniref:Trigger factor n=1 Tax=Megamonas rupellensis TaxID=491921 RepID=A0A412CCK7_9FIRM|nr:trigger factor [Megamonas rupellensis]RGQ78961.1 trigger factor [Megamonas rupellensis]
MNVTTEKIENHKVVLTIEVPAEELDKGIKAACKSLANRVNIPGFRKGKAPRRILEMNIGKEAILDEAFDRVAQKAFDEALKQENLDPVDRPQVDIVTLEEGKDVVFKATITPVPEVTLGEYKGLKVAKDAAEVKDEQVEEQVKNILNHHAKMVDAEEGATVANDDFITLDFKGEVDGVAFAGGEGKDYPLQIGSHSFIDTFEDQLVGLKVGEEKDVNVTFPEEYHAKDLAGKAAVFHCKINSIKHKEMPELTDEFVKASTSYESIEDMKAKLRENIEKNAQREADTKRRNEILKQATDNITVDIPEVMVENRVSNMIQELSVNLENQGMNLDAYLKYANMDMAKLREQYKESAAIAVKTDLMLDAVAKAEDIKVENADINAEIALLAATYGTTPQEVSKIIKKNHSIGNLVATVLHKKAANFIIDSAVEA